MRGRVMGIYMLGFLGMMPVGALLAGAVAEFTSEPTTVAIGGLIMVGFALWLWLRVPQLRTLEQKGEKAWISGPTTFRPGA